MLIETTPDTLVPSPAPVRRGSRHPWHAITIVAPAHACAAALAHKGKRLLSTEAPLLPLKGCDASTCECRYRHFEDRRGAPRRKDEKGVATKPRNQSNRRIRRGRRASD